MCRASPRNVKNPNHDSFIQSILSVKTWKIVFLGTNFTLSINLEEELPISCGCHKETLSEN